MPTHPELHQARPASNAPQWSAPFPVANHRSRHTPAGNIAPSPTSPNPLAVGVLLVSIKKAPQPADAYLQRQPRASSTPGGPMAQGDRAYDPRDLQELQPACKLRAAGWTLPDSLPEDYLVRVYDTRIEDGYRQTLCQELHLAADPICIIGGDFITAPFRQDSRRCVQLPCGAGDPRSGPFGVGSYAGRGCSWFFGCSTSGLETFAGVLA